MNTLQIAAFRMQNIPIFFWRWARIPPIVADPFSVCPFSGPRPFNASILMSSAFGPEYPIFAHRSLPRDEEA